MRVRSLLTAVMAMLAPLPPIASADELAVTNVQAEQRPGTGIIDVTYDLQTVGNMPVMIRLFLSTDSGETFPLQCLTVSGHAGAGVLPGSGLQIEWNAGVDFPGFTEAACRLRVMADDSPHAEQFIFIPPGAFLMGSPQDEPGRYGDETLHEVTISQGLFISRHAVTGELWSQVMGGTPSDPQLPVTQVSWDMAVEFCNALSLLEGLEPVYLINGPGGNVVWSRDADGYRLPTEAEWEYACRAGSQEAFANGPISSIGCTPLDPVLDAIGWYCGNTSEPMPVGQKPANAWGLYDMHGGSSDWVWDAYLAAYENLDAVDPVHEGSPGDSRVNRGGRWYAQARDCRSAARAGLQPGDADAGTGFRFARTAFITQEAPPNGEWSQHAHNPQRTGYTGQYVPAPWRWKWSWNGPDSSGGISQGKTSLPRNVQPVTGGGRVYIARGGNGVIALSEDDGSVIWSRSLGGSVNATVAYDAGGSLYVPGSDGILYRLDPSTGSTLNTFNAGAPITTPPCVIGDRLFISAGASVHALGKSSLAPVWVYDAGSAVQTPPSYSPSRDRVIVCTEDLYVHAIENSSGQQAWRVKPSPRNPSGDVNFTNGWPVIAETHGLVLVKMRLDWNTMWNWSPWPTTNAAIRANLLSQPDQQCLHALSLDDGSVPFVCNIGHGGYGNGGYMPMGPQPVVRRFPDNTETAYIMIRGKSGPGIDGRWDTNFGEMVLDDATIPGLQAGHVRWINYDGSVSSGGYPAPTDEQHNVTMAGDHLFGGHWMAGQPLRILDRSENRGTYTSPITSANLPHIVTSTSVVPYSPSHYSSINLVQDGDPRSFPPGFYIYHGQGTVYDTYWSEYAVWTVSNGTVYFRSCDGAIVALEHGDPRGDGQANRVAGPESTQTHLRRDVRREATTDPGALPAESPLVRLHEAAVHSGRHADLEGTLRYVHNNGKAMLLGFDDPHAGTFKVMIRKSDWSSFPGLDGRMGRNVAGLYREGMTVRASGVIEWYQGDPVIYARSPAQILVQDGSMP